MNKRWFSLAGALIVIVISVLSWGRWKAWNQVSKSIGNRSVSGRPSTPIPGVATGTSRPKDFVLGAPPTKAQIAQRQARWAQFFHTPLVVYGKVIDERGKPISGAIVEIATVNGMQSTDKDLRTTDDGGLFSVVGKQGLGYSLRASRNGYYTIKQSTAHRNVLTPAKADSSDSTPAEPIVLVLYKRGTAEALLVGKTGQIDMPKSGKSVHVRLAGERTGRGQLEIASQIGALNDSRFDWRYTINIPGGGIIERLGQFDFEAPVDGYLESVEYNMPASAQNWSVDGKREYFARLPDGRFARFSIQFYPGQQRNFVVINSFTNPLPGHRNLEFDSMKIREPGN